jgi:catechol 2,3-dioxygenase-like lactoylglutathione lyase family enzyme
MAFSGLDHVVIRVKDLDAAVEGYKKILGTEPKRATSAALKAAQAFFYFSNGTFLELIQPTDDWVKAYIPLHSRPTMSRRR